MKIVLYTDTRDRFREIAEIYGVSWGIGRAQIFGKQEEPLEFFSSGYPRDNAVFTNVHRWHQTEVPLIWVSNPEVQADLITWRKRQNSRHHFDFQMKL